MDHKHTDRSLAGLLSAYLKSGPEEKRSILQYLRDHNPYLLAHHPPEGCFRSHVWKLAGFYWCKGCVMATAGAMTALILQLATGWLNQLSDAEVALVVVALLLPTFASLLYPRSTALKHVARFHLGAASVSAVMQLLLTESWLIRCIIIICFFSIRQPLVYYRNRLNHQILEGTSGNLP